jgi:hypothetical protein
MAFGDRLLDQYFPAPPEQGEARGDRQQSQEENRDKKAAGTHGLPPYWPRGKSASAALLRSLCDVGLSASLLARGASNDITPGR